jgi:hypothetical protein
MDGDLGKKLDALLNSPEGMAKIGQAMAALGIPSEPEPAAPAPAPQPTPVSPPESSSSSEMPDLSALLKLAPLFSSFGKDDENTTLLKALRPYLHGEREKRLDESMKLMQLLKLLPILQERGIFR